MKTIKELKSEIKSLQDKAHENGWKCPIHISKCLNEYDYRRYISKLGKLNLLKDVLKLIGGMFGGVPKDDCPHCKVLFKLKSKIEG